MQITTFDHSETTILNPVKGDKMVKAFEQILQ